MEAYCVKCRTKRQMKAAKAITMKNGRPATQVPYEKEISPLLCCGAFPH